MKRFGRIMLVAAMTASLVVTPVMATPSVSDLESSKATAEREAQSLQAQLTELLSKMGKLEEDLIATGEEIIQAEADLAEAEDGRPDRYGAHHPVGRNRALRHHHGSRAVGRTHFDGVFQQGSPA